MKLSLKLSLSMAFLTVIIIFSNSFSMYQLNRVNSSTVVIASVWLPSLVSIQELNTNLSDFRIAEIQHAINSSDVEMSRYEDMLNALQKRFDVLTKQYEVTPRSAEEDRSYKDFLRFKSEYDSLHIQLLQLSRTDKNEEAMNLLNGPAREIYYKCTAELEKIVQLNLRGTRQARADSTAIYENSIFSLTAVLVFAILAAAIVAFLLIRGILRQLGKDPGQLMQVAERVTHGDFNIDDGSPKIGVYGNIVTMVQTLQHTIAQAQGESERAQQASEKAQESTNNAEAASIRASMKTDAMLKAADRLESVANVVSSASSQLSAQIEQSERGATEQASRVTETATAMEEMNSTVLEVAKNASTAADVSVATRQKAEAGADVVRKSVKSIQDVQQQATKLRQDMDKLNENAQNISRIMGVISDIADQTNLLALNAAIEAARAGDAGRGFAVVADEVRKLAEKTMASTSDVGNAIRAIQQSATESMAQVDYSAKFIEEATEYATLSGKALEEIVRMVDTSADQVRAIATASEEQSSTSDEITRSISQINVIASETARAMGEAAQAVVDLAGQAQVLSGLIEEMKSDS